MTTSLAAAGGHNRLQLFLVAVGTSVLASTAMAQSPPDASADESKEASTVAKANNPLTAATGLNIQDYYAPTLYGVPNQTANNLLLRGIIPFKIGLPQIARITLPFSSVPLPGSFDATSGVGDLNIFDIVLLTDPDSKFQLGIGPELTFPTASGSLVGSGKWQLGAAMAVIWTPTPTLLLGGLITWQTDVAGDGARVGVQALLTQPFLILQLGSGYYLRSSAIPTFEFKSGVYAVPFGVGAGKVVRMNQFVLNMFLEPQFTALHYGSGQPAFQIFSGLNVQIFN